MKPQPNAYFLTGGLGAALEAQNARTHLALHAAHIDIKDTNKALADVGRPGRTALVDSKGRTIYPGHDLDVFCRDHVTAKRFARMGEAIAGVDALPPILWPDMKKVEAAAKVPMTPETKEKLRAHAAARTRSVGDEIAGMLEGKDLPAVYEIAAKYLGEDEAAMIKKYAHLNPGQQRMVCGNRMRAKWKAENLKAGAPARVKK